MSSGYRTSPRRPWLWPADHDPAVVVDRDAAVRGLGRRSARTVVLTTNHSAWQVEAAARGGNPRRGYLTATQPDQSPAEFRTRT